MLGAGGVRGDERQVDLRALRSGKLDLGLLSRLLEALQRHPVVGQVDAGIALEAGDEPVDDPLVEVVPSQVGVAVGGLDLEYAVAEFEDGDVEGAAAKVVDRDLLLGAFLVEPIGERCGRRLVDDPLDIEAGDPPGILGRLPLRVVEVGASVTVSPR